MRVLAHSAFDANGRPLIFGIKSADNSPIILPLYHQDNKIPIYDIWENERKLCHIMNKAPELVLNNYKACLDHFSSLAPIGAVYDAALSTDDASQDSVRDTLQRMSDNDSKPWQRALAAVAPVYQDLELRGVIANFMQQWPQWSLQTYTSRSKSSGFNIQGITDVAIQNPLGMVDDVFVCFDWVAADIRVAALLSQDDTLMDISSKGDPYVMLMEIFSGLDRDECKIGLLMAINQMDSNHEILKPFPKLAAWIKENADRLAGGMGVQTILGREFCPAPNVKTRAPFNAMMQGSIAHAMHNCLKRVWDAYGSELVTEIHDSIVMTCPKFKLPTLIADVVEIMRHPFLGLLDMDPLFSVSVNIGKVWRQWQPYKTYIAC